MAKKEERYHIRALDRAISVLSILSDGTPRTMVELAEACNLSVSTMFRILATLADHHYVERDDVTGKYALGFACLELARSYQMHNHIRRVALPELEKLRDETKETIHLAILDNMEVAYLEKLHGLHAIGLMSSQVGGRALAYCTGLGKALLAHEDPDRVRAHFSQHGLKVFTDTTIRTVDELMAHLARIREQGYATDYGEHEPEVFCIAAPIFDAGNHAVAAISISGPSNRMMPLESGHNLTRILEAARNISRQLGYATQPEESTANTKE
ncbi:MAG: IclR family transcriptional regulator [Anaerolineae bacterium]